MMFGVSQQFDNERYRHKDEEDDHQNQLHGNDFSQGGMKETNTSDYHSAECQLYPARICDLVGHLERDDDYTERVDHRGESVKRQEAVSYTHLRAHETDSYL